MVDMIVDQRLFCLANGFLDCMELLGQIEARPTVLDHGDDATQVALGSPQALDDVRMALMNEGVFQDGKPILLDRINLDQVGSQRARSMVSVPRCEIRARAVVSRLKFRMAKNENAFDRSCAVQLARPDYQRSPRRVPDGKAGGAGRDRPR